MQPQITIGMPVFNGAAYLRETVASLLAQDYSRLRIHIADNASDDGTEAICREIAAADQRIVYHRHKENIGALRNFNYLIRECATPYFMLAGAHDRWAPSFVSSCIDLLQADPAVVVAYSIAGRIDEQGGEIAGLFSERLDTRGLSPLARYRKTIWELAHLAAIYGVMRTEALQKTRGFALDVWGADHLLLAELSLLGPFAQIPSVLFWLRLPHGQETEDERKQRVAQACHPEKAQQVASVSWQNLHRQTLLGHLALVAKSRLPWHQRLYARALTMLCFHIRFLAPLTRNHLLNHLLSVAIHRSRVWRIFKPKPMTFLPLS